LSLATQTVLDPRRLGKQNSGFSDEDLADIICILIPSSEHAQTEVNSLRGQGSIHLVGGGDASEVEEGLAALADDDDDNSNLGLMPRGRAKYAIALRFSALEKLKDPLQGFVFGRNPNRCDVPLVHDPKRRLSNVQFRIYYNQHRVLMVQDVSTNGTVVDGLHLKSSNNRTMRTLNNGSTVRMLMHLGKSDLDFLVRIPRREGQYEQAYRDNLARYMAYLEQLRIQRDQLHPDADATIGPGPGGHVDLFPAAVARARRPNAASPSSGNTEHLSRAWTGSDRYHVVGEIGKGAFATVYKVTDKWEGTPYAAKELDKRKFMKNGVLDQKVENEMTIMQKIQHVSKPLLICPTHVKLGLCLWAVSLLTVCLVGQPNIVRYIEHLDWDSRLLLIIMEYVAGGDLGRLILENGSLLEEAVKTMALQLLDALGYLHENNITHRDVKPDNILVSSQAPFVVKLTDFGLSKMVDNEQTFLRTFCGTLLYCAPEVYTEFAEYDEFGNRHPRNRQRRQVRGQRYDHAVDIWSLGGVLFFAMTGRPPYPVRGGISYSELLHRIMTEDLDISPLLEARISTLGIDFIRRMLDRRPETRATVTMLKDHPWLGGTGEAFYRGKNAGESYDEISDDEQLDQQASQLSLTDRRQDVEDPEDDDAVQDENLCSGYESEKENYTLDPGTQTQELEPARGARLFGEVNVSAIGSSGVIPSNRLNLPVSASGTSFGTTEILAYGDNERDEEYEIKDSFESEDNTPKQKVRSSQRQSNGSQGQGLRISVLSAGQSRSVEHINNMTFNVESQDLGGTESIMEHLNMRSAAVSNFVSHDSHFFTASKRKVAYDSSEGSEQNSAIHDRPTLKRFRSELLPDSMTDYSSEDVDGEYELLAHMPAVVQARSTRQMDEPVNKSTYWTAGDRKSYHLRYPEMTQLQLDAFMSAAKARNEDFGPGKSPLWDLAMKYFPPTHYEQAVGRMPLDVETASSASGDINATRNQESETRSLEQIGSDEDDDIPDTLPQPQAIVVPVPSNPPGRRIVASLQSSPESGIADISIHVTESLLSWGRAPDNTRIYEPKTEIKVPKYAFKILLWKPDYDPSRDSRPWNKNYVQDEESYHFYMSTKSSHGIYINERHLPSNEPKAPSADSKHWVRLHDGDKIVVCYWQKPSAEWGGKTEVVFRCAWGGSSVPRGELPASAIRDHLISDDVARELDNFCAKAEKRVKADVEHDSKITEAELDRDERAQNICNEKERSRLFELKRQEARRVLAGRHSRRASPASAPPAIIPAPGARKSPGLGMNSVARTIAQ
jgi:serine/threonine protein kinase